MIRSSPLMLSIESTPIRKLHPQSIEARAVTARLDRTLSPPSEGLIAGGMPERDLQETCGSISEWLALVQLSSPRVSADDHVDPYLSRYAVPGSDKASTIDLISLKWHGFISSSWTTQLFAALL